MAGDYEMVQPEAAYRDEMVQVSAAVQKEYGDSGEVLRYEAIHEQRVPGCLLFVYERG